MRTPFILHEGCAAPLMQDNIDTDQIIPSREMKTVSRTGLADGLFAGWRYVKPGGRDVDPSFVLNRPDYSAASILVVGENFGCGSSREHAVWALAEFGIKVIVAKSFGAIFQGNCPGNGILPLALQPDRVEWIAAQLPSRIAIDLPAQKMNCAGRDFAFEVDSFAKRLLVEGLDPIALTLKSHSAIADFKAEDAKARPWLY